MTLNQQIILVDAYAQLYRGYYGVRYLTTSKGTPSNAVFALAKFLLQLDKDYPSPYGAFVFDLGKSVYRIKIAPDYKANRAPMPDDMKAQVPAMRKLIRAFGWPIVEHEGIEADDIIAAFSTQFAEYPVRIISSDKDIMQLVSNRIQMLIPDRKKSGSLKQHGPVEVLSKFSVPPDKIVDYLALIGDNSDNIPGVQGVGPKTASKLINQFGSISEILEQVDKIDNEKLREKIKASAEILAKNIKLISLDSEIPNPTWQTIETVTRTDYDWETIDAIINEFELKSIATEIGSRKSSQSTETPNTEKTTAPKSEIKNNSGEYYTPDLL